MTTKQQPSYWLFLHPYVYVSIKKGKTILYNTLNGTLLEFDETEKEILKLLEKLNSDTHLYVVKIRKEEINDNLARFIEKLRETYSGDIIDTSSRPHKPFQPKPILNLHRTLDYLTEGGEKNKIPVNDQVKDYLNVITIYLNGACEQTCPMCQTAFKQFPCCRKTCHQGTIDIEDIRRLLAETKGNSLKRLNIIGGNIFRYSHLIPLVMELNPLAITRVYHLHYLNLRDNPEFYKEFRAGAEKNRLNVTVHFPLNRDAFNAAFKQLQNENLLKVKFAFVIQSIEDMTGAEEIIAAHNIRDFEFYPYYNGGNLAFFKDNVFINREALVETKPGMNDILARQLINSQEFKKLTILNTKEIFANPNNPRIGRLGQDNIYNLIFRELHKGKSWTKTRKNVTPCKSCVYNALCPPISSYEYVMGRYNLCTINE
ncbi:MAG: TIGR04150 pseudo-rSAM protein [Candidatus Aminicenantes bacterium]|nr:TIGR04150 pseudo-rSAM protein [Candidatus Aminicenantes bacterium]